MRASPWGPLACTMGQGRGDLTGHAWIIPTSSECHQQLRSSEAKVKPSSRLPEVILLRPSTFVICSLLRGDPVYRPRCKHSFQHNVVQSCCVGMQSRADWRPPYSGREQTCFFGAFLPRSATSKAETDPKSTAAWGVQAGDDARPLIYRVMKIM